MTDYETHTHKCVYIYITCRDVTAGKNDMKRVFMDGVLRGIQAHNIRLLSPPRSAG